MGTRGIQDPVAADLIEQLLAEQARLNEEIMDLRQAMPVLMERARPADITVPQEGQIIVDPDATHSPASDEPIKYFENGEWRALTAAAASSQEMPWCAALGGSNSVQLQQADFDAGPNIWNDIPFDWTSATNVNYRGYDYSSVGSKVFDTSKSKLPGFSPLGIRKKGLYIFAVGLYTWNYSWGKLTRVYIEPSSVSPNNTFMMFGMGSAAPSQMTIGATVIEAEKEAGDTTVAVHTLGVFRKVSDATTDWPYMKGRHITAATRSFVNCYFTAIRLSPNPFDTHAFNGGTIPG